VCADEALTGPTANNPFSRRALADPCLPVLTQGGRPRVCDDSNAATESLGKLRPENFKSNKQGRRFERRPGGSRPLSMRPKLIFRCRNYNSGGCFLELLSPNKKTVQRTNTTRPGSGMQSTSKGNPGNGPLL
jgi:hypothetical protein